MIWICCDLTRPHPQLGRFDNIAAISHSSAIKKWLHITSPQLLKPRHAVSKRRMGYFPIQGWPLGTQLGRKSSKINWVDSFDSQLNQKVFFKPWDFWSPWCFSKNFLTTANNHWLNYITHHRCRPSLKMSPDNRQNPKKEIPSSNHPFLRGGNASFREGNSTILGNTPPKTNMEPENEPLEEEIPMKNHHF